MDLRDVPAHGAAAAYAFDCAKWNPSRCQVHRYRVVYPVPVVSFTWWSRLADPPSAVGP